MSVKWSVISLTMAPCSRASRTWHTSGQPRSVPCSRAEHAAGLCYVALALLAIMSGCVGYRLGSTLPPDVKSIYVRPFVNKCNEPLLEIDAINATIAEFQKDATLRIEPADEADLLLEATLDALTLTPLRYSQADKAKPNEYRLTLHVSFVLKRARTREIMSEASVIGESTFAFIGNLTASKRAAIPLAAEDLAKRIVEKVVETW